MLAIIDGDILAYAACKPRWQDKAENGFVTIELDEDGNRKPFEFTKKEDQMYLQQCWGNLKKELDKLLDRVFCTEYIMAVKGENNFRDKVYHDYKANRKNNPNNHNVFVPSMRKLMVKEDYAIEATGREADDLVRIWAEESRMSGRDFIVCSIDKDLKCIPGKHYLMHKDEVLDISEEYAMRFYYEQLLKGDPTDNIPGVPRVGDVKAKKLLADFNTEQEFQEVVLNAYIAAYGDDWHHMLLVNGKMIHIQRDVGDYFCFDEWPLAQELL